MQGLILDQFRQYVASRYGFRAWTQALAAAGRPVTHHYALDEDYPDEELRLVALKTAEVTARPFGEVLEGFGEALVPEMLRLYSFLLDPGWDYGDFLLHAEPILHKVHELHAPGVPPTRLRARRLGPKTMELVYDSPARLCSIVSGVIKGAAHEYGVSVELSQETCMLRGDPACKFKVTFDERSADA